MSSTTESLAEWTVAEAGAISHPFLNWFTSGAHSPDAIDAAQEGFEVLIG